MLNFLSGFIEDELLRAYEPEKIVFYLTTYQKAMTELVTNSKIWTIIKEE